MKLLIIGDLHFHTWKQPQLLKFQNEFMESFIPSVIKQYSPNGIVFMGDIFESRKMVDKQLVFKVLSWIEDLSTKLQVYLVIGNHDYYTEEVSPFEIEHILKHAKVFTEYGSASFNGFKLVFLPWNSWKKEIPIEFFGNNTLAFSHADIVGISYPSEKSSPSTGLNKDIVSKFYYLFNGHYHKRSRYGNIINVGSVMQRTLSDYGDQKCLTLFDTSNSGILFIDIPHPIIKIISSRLEYDQLVQEARDDIIPIYVRKVEENQLNRSSGAVGGGTVDLLKLTVNSMLELSKEYNISNLDYGVSLLEQVYGPSIREIINENKGS